MPRHIPRQDLRQEPRHEPHVRGFMYMFAHWLFNIQVSIDHTNTAWVLEATEGVAMSGG